MIVTPTAIPGVKIIEPQVFGDERGFFYESYNRSALVRAGIEAEFVQESHSRSSRHVLRGLHYQIRHAQGKLVRVIAGEVLDVAVDIRRSSPTFGRHVSVVLSAENKRSVWIPPGFAHGFVVRSDSADFCYKATDYYAPPYERAIFWNDAELGIDWQLETAPILSAKDHSAGPFSEAETYE